MFIFDFLKVSYPELDPVKSKLHFATFNKGSSIDPLALFRRDRCDFKKWQESQSRKNFERPYITSFIQYAGEARWLFAGCYKVDGWKEEDGDDFGNSGTRTIYATSIIEETDEYAGRLVVNFEKGWRATYVCGETCADGLKISEILATGEAFPAFPGFPNVKLDLEDLKHIVRTELPTWKSALSCTGGIYVILDKNTGKLYVGQAFGERGFWGRWSEYADNGHGGNENLKALLSKNTKYATDFFQLSVLETHSLDKPKSMINEREVYWQDVLGTRQHGNN